MFAAHECRLQTVQATKTMSLQAILSPSEDPRSLAGSCALPGTAADCIACAFGKKGESAVAAYSDGRLVSWDLRDREEVCVTHNSLPQCATAHRLLNCSALLFRLV